MTAARLNKAVTFAAHTTKELTLAAGSVVKIHLIGTDSIIITFAGRKAIVPLDDASPVEWDDDEEMWIES